VLTMVPSMMTREIAKEIKTSPIQRVREDVIGVSPL